MKICTTKDTSAGTPGSRIKLGIVRLGKIAGKVKYAVIDERDAWILRQFGFEGRLDVDANGDGACIYAWCYDLRNGRYSGRYAHDLIWEFHRGGVAPGWKVGHVNRVGIDNRLDNLTVIPAKSYSPYGSESKARREHSLYWMAMTNIPLEPIEQQYKDWMFTRYVDKQGNYVARQEEYLYECRYFPCSSLEQRMRQFAICGRCQEARYCGPHCQQRDWSSHKKYCQERIRPRSHDTSPER